jgi:AcrR family transcriptional regulator
MNAMPAAASTRTERKNATRRRIVEATLALHSTIGPARTSISGVAERAGVPRLTVYRHFPDQRELELACSTLAVERDPLPDPATWAQADPEARLSAALEELYRYYARNEGLLANVLRDADVVPTTQEMVQLRLAPALALIRDALAGGFPVAKGRRRELLAAVELAIAFDTWRLLVRKRRLPRRTAVELMVALVTTTQGGADGTDPAPRRRAAGRP